MGLPSGYMADILDISESHFSNIFNTWVALIASQLELVCKLPPGQEESGDTAKCFDAFPGVRVVLDCTEVFSQTPGHVKNKKKSYSNYKGHSTFKFLVGMSPSGAITYISDMWGGKASDNKITWESDLYDTLEVGDSVMVDRGFTIRDDLPAGVKLIIPPFKNRETGQFTAKQLQFAEQIAMARIHVERAMRAIKEFRLLAQEAQLSMSNNYGNIFKACGYLCNWKYSFLRT